MALLSVLRDFIGHGVGGGNESRAERTHERNTREEGAAQRKKWVICRVTLEESAGQ